MNVIHFDAEVSVDARTEFLPLSVASRGVIIITPRVLGVKSVRTQYNT